MRRWLVLPISALTVLAIGAWPTPAVGIPCPEATGVGQPCCPTPTNARDASAACCPTACCTPSCCPTACCGAGQPQPACPVEQLTITTSPNPSTEGKTVTVSGKLTNGSPGETVYLWQKLAGQSSFTRIAQTTTDTAGDYKLVRGAGFVTTNASWYTSAVGADSATVLQRVSARVKLATRRVAGTLVEVDGSVSPTHRGERISLQQYSHVGSWRAIAIAMIGPRSRFTLRHRFAHRGAVLLRAVFEGDARNTRSTSAALKIFVP